jgi:hypothetical protein
MLLMKVNGVQAMECYVFEGLDNDNLAFRSHRDDFTAGTDNNELLLLVADNEPADKLFASAAFIHESYSSPAITAIMERIKAWDRTAFAVMQQDVEHHGCIVDNLKILEDAQCPDYMLQSILEWAFNAQSMGFDFNPQQLQEKPLSLFLNIGVTGECFC